MPQVVSGLVAMIRNPDITSAELMEHIPAPDFPTGAIWFRGGRRAWGSGKGWRRWAEGFKQGGAGMSRVA